MSGKIIAIDGGASRSEYLLADASGRIEKIVSGGSVNVSAVSVGVAGYNAREGVRQLLQKEATNTDSDQVPPALFVQQTLDEEIELAVIATAGLDTKQDLRRAEQVLGETLREWPIKKIVIINDAVAALTAGTSKRPAMVIIGGTGSNCIGVSSEGQWSRMGGLDYLLSDEGSGFDAGRLTLRAVARALDGRGMETTLTKPVLRHFEVDNLAELKDVIYSRVPGKDEIAALAKVCSTQALAGDQVAIHIVNYCLGQLFTHVQALAYKLGLAETQFDLVAGGSFLLCWREEFAKMIADSGLPAVLIIPEKSPVYGALEISCQIVAGQNPKQWAVFV